MVKTPQFPVNYYQSNEAWFPYRFSTCDAQVQLSSACGVLQWPPHGAAVAGGRATASFDVDGEKMRKAGKPFGIHQVK